MTPPEAVRDPDRPLESPLDADDHPSSTTTTGSLPRVSGPIGCLPSEPEEAAAPKLASRWFVLRRQWPIMVWLVVVWIGLWGDLSIANVLGGLAVVLLIGLAAPMPIFPARLRIRPVALARLAGWFVLDLLRASVHVAWLAWRPGPPTGAAVLRVPLRTRSEAVMSLVAELTSLVPGSIVLETDPTAGVLIVHSLGLAGEEDVEQVRQDALRLEQRVVAAFGDGGRDSR